MVGNTTSRRRLAGSLFFALVAPFGCAASPILPDEDGWEDEARGANTEHDAAEPDQPSERDPPESREPAPPKNVRDAAAPEPAPWDASAEPPGGGHDAAPPDEDGREGGLIEMAARDAGGADSAAQRDASGSASDAASWRDADSATQEPDPRDEPAGSCRQASDCTQPCVPIGLFNCCRASGTCGCTWAPGAYCS